MVLMMLAMKQRVYVFVLIEKEKQNVQFTVLCLYIVSLKKQAARRVISYHQTPYRSYFPQVERMKAAIRQLLC